MKQEIFYLYFCFLRRLGVEKELIDRLLEGSVYIFRKEPNTTIETTETNRTIETKGTTETIRNAKFKIHTGKSGVGH